MLAGKKLLYFLKEVVKYCIVNVVFQHKKLPEGADATMVAANDDGKFLFFMPVVYGLLSSEILISITLVDCYQGCCILPADLPACHVSCRVIL